MKVTDIWPFYLPLGSTHSSPALACASPSTSIPFMPGALGSLLASEVGSLPGGSECRVAPSSCPWDPCGANLRCLRKEASRRNRNKPRSRDCSSLTTQLGWPARNSLYYCPDFPSRSLYKNKPQTHVNTKLRAHRRSSRPHCVEKQPECGNHMCADVEIVSRRVIKFKRYVSKRVQGIGFGK